MNTIFHLSGEQRELAKAEIEAVCSPEQVNVRGCYLWSKVNKQISSQTFSRLAYTKAVYQILFSCPLSTLEKNLSVWNNNPYQGKSFSVRCIRLGDKEKKQGSNLSSPSSVSISVSELGKLFWKSLNHAPVQLRNPQTAFVLFMDETFGNGTFGSETFVWVTVLIHEGSKGFAERKAHLRPGFSPVSLHPKLARAVVNLTQIPYGHHAILVDPFCGTGGFLIEAGLMGFQVKGYDLDPRMITKCEQNLLHYGIQQYELFVQNALTLTTPFPYLVMDLPYGRNTSKKGLSELYFNVGRWLQDVLLERAVVVLPHTIDLQQLWSSFRLNCKQRFTVYIHRSLTKQIVVVKHTNTG
ncbi:hypothetical protein HYW21_09025 [Candidatus Woesearchaeota archaeon]|nr:hypothetical protein [Candidatus Woesearchaeota archaeon]